jgi:phage terminase large subunit GpA-like protein
MFQDQPIMGVCRLYPMTQNKQRTDWCGQFAAIETARAVTEVPVYDIMTDTIKPQVVARIKRKYERKNVQTPA